MMVYDFSKFDEITRADLRILEAYITTNFSSELSMPMKLTQDKQERLKMILGIVGVVEAKYYEDIKLEKLKEAGKVCDLGWF